MVTASNARSLDSRSLWRGCRMEVQLVCDKELLVSLTEFQVPLGRKDNITDLVELLEETSDRYIIVVKDEAL